MKKRSKHASPLQIAGVTAVISAATVGVLWFNGTNKKPIQVPSYRALRVIDGDTFETEEHQIIRLASVEAPEKGLCGAPEATKALEKLISKKPIVLKVMFTDQYDRLVSLVYTGEEFINAKLLEKGFAYYYRGTVGFSDELQKLSNAAREKKVGIFSESCTQTTNIKQPSCDIKGNTRNGNIYYRSDCGVYPNVEVQLYLGDRWFCKEFEAKNAGFRKPSQCP